MKIGDRIQHVSGYGPTYVVVLNRSEYSDLIAITKDLDPQFTRVINEDNWKIISHEDIAVVEPYLQAIRKHRDQKLDDRCWMDDYELYSVLPEGLEGVDLRLLPKTEMMKNCEHYIDCRSITNSPEEALKI